MISPRLHHFLRFRPPLSLRLMPIPCVRIRNSVPLAVLLLLGAATLPAQASPRSNGAFRLGKYESVRDSALTSTREYVRRQALLEAWTKNLNDWIRLPMSVELAFKECGEPNASYESPPAKITICYELVRELDLAFEKESDTTLSESEKEGKTLGAVSFIFFHELGHALIDLFDLPTLGRNEDAADGLAAYLLIDADEDDDGSGELAAVHGVDGLNSLEADNEESELDFADEHSFSEQRFYNVICFLYGSNPVAFKELVSAGTLPKERSNGCAQDYKKLNRDWDRLLKPWLK